MERNKLLVATITLAGLVAVLFLPAVRFEFVKYDVPEQVLDNPHIRGLTWENVRHIFTSRSITSYYPVRTLTYAVDYQIWGLVPHGFKLTNFLIHLANVLLAFWLVIRLLRRSGDGDSTPKRGGRMTPRFRKGTDRDQPPVGVRLRENRDSPQVVTRPPLRRWDVATAAVAVAVFAVHPVVVEPVVWVPGREELLMTLGALGCLHFHITARRLEQEKRTGRALVCYVAAACSCAAACLSNAVAAVLPAIVVAWDVVFLTRPTLRQILRGTGALWAIGIATFVIKRLGEYVDPVGEVAACAPERLMLVLNAFWLNVKSLAWPSSLTVSYPRLAPAGFLDANVLRGAMALVFLGAAIWIARRRKAVRFGFVWFAVSLLPTAQILPHHIHRADRFLYLPLAGLAVALAAGLRASARPRRSTAAVGTFVAASVVLVLAVASAVQIRTWRNSVTVWEQCLRFDRQSGLTHCYLAERLAERGEFRRAVEHFEKAIDLPEAPERAMARLALLLADCEQEEIRNYDRAISLAERAGRQDPEEAPALTLVYTKVAGSLAKRGEFVSAIENYRLALDARPNNKPALCQLALLLATCPDESLRRNGEAVRLADRAYALMAEPSADDLRALATVYYEAGRLDEAIAMIREAIELAGTDNGDRHQVDQLRRRLRSYQERVSRGRP